LAKLIYSAITSLDGYIEDAEGKFEWAEPDEEVHAFVNDLERPIGTYLCGRRMYETMVFWESPTELTAQPPFVQDFAEIWQRADNVVYSRTYQLFLVPVGVGGGKRSLPGNDVRVNLELLDERRFRNGTVYLHYRTRS
jgi:dihydrofolate reductase